MTELLNTPRRKGKNLSVRFVGDDDVSDFIKPLEDIKISSQENPNEHPATPRSSRRRGRPSLYESEKETPKKEDDIQDCDTNLNCVIKSISGFDEEIENGLSGKQIYGFRTPKKDNQMTKIASESIKALTPKSAKALTPKSARALTPKSARALTPKSARGLTPKSANKINSASTPKSKRKSVVGKDIDSADNINMTPKSRTRESYQVLLDEENQKTPYNLRMKIKKRIVHMIEEDERDFSSSESEYVPSDKEESSGEEENILEEENTIEEEISKSNKSTSRYVSTPKRRENKYVYSVEDYFNSRKISKSQTSNHTLSRLKTPKLSHTMLKEILQKMKSPHEKHIKKLNMNYEKYFDKWLFSMRQGYSILLYGLGSKRNTLNSFHQKLLSDSQVVVVNGFFPSLSMKSILHSITDDIMGLNSKPASLLECVRVIEQEFNDDSSEELFLLVHNLDGLMLRNELCQNIFSRLASAKNIHLIASVDHINSPLLWDPSKLSLFNFLWFDVTTMLPYIEETSFENSSLVKQSGALALSSLKSVFNSLTSNAKGVFLIMVKYQLENKGNANYSGIAFRDLYWKSREAFLLSSDLALRAQLTEFLDHHMVKSRVGPDGDERLTIPIDNSILQDFLDEDGAK